MPVSLRQRFVTTCLSTSLFMLALGVMVNQVMAQPVPLPAPFPGSGSSQFEPSLTPPAFQGQPLSWPQAGFPAASPANGRQAPATPSGRAPVFQFSNPVNTTPVQAPPATSSSSVLRSQFGSQQFPAGTLLTIRFGNTLDSRLTQAGEPFTALLVEDLVASGQRLVLPKGTLFRGRVTQAQGSKWFGKGGALGLTFDHVVLSNGLPYPVALKLALANAKVAKGRFYTDPGYGQKVQQHLDEGADLIGSTIRKGAAWGDSWGGHGIGKVLTVPVAAIGGGLGGAGLFAGKSVYSAIAPGQAVAISPSDVVLIELEQDTVFPTE
jgi:hypothetical protein